MITHLATRPSAELPLSGTATRLECIALAQMLERRTPPRPSGVYWTLVTTVVLRDGGEAEWTHLALSYPEHDREAVAYVSEVESALEGLKVWDVQARALLPLL